MTQTEARGHFAKKTRQRDGALAFSLASPGFGQLARVASEMDSDFSVWQVFFVPKARREVVAMPVASTHAMMNGKTPEPPAQDVWLEAEKAGYHNVVTWARENDLLELQRDALEMHEEELAVLFPLLGPRRRFTEWVSTLKSKAITEIKSEPPASLVIRLRTFKPSSTELLAASLPQDIVLVRYGSKLRVGGKNTLGQPLVAWKLYNACSTEVAMRATNHGPMVVKQLALSATRFDIFDRNPESGLVSLLRHSPDDTQHILGAQFPDLPNPLLDSMRVKVQRAGETGVCTFSVSGRKFVKQIGFSCKTCFPEGANRIVCMGCKSCHEGHDIGPPHKSRMYCDCGSGDGPEPCQAKKALE